MDHGTDAVVPGLPAGTAENDILLLLCEDTLGTYVAPTGYVATADSPQLVTGGADASKVRLYAFWKRAGSSEAAPTVAFPTGGNHNHAVILGFSGCITTGDPWDVTAGDADETVDTVVDIPGDTTTVGETLVVTIVADSNDSASTTRITDWANAALTSVTERLDGGTIIGAGGGISAATGEKATAGAFGATTATLATTSKQARIAIALKPPSGGAVTGTIAATQDAQTAAISGTVANPVTGIVAVTQANQTAAFTGTVTVLITGTVAVTQDSQTASITGTVANPVTGTVAVTQSDQTMVASGLLTITGTFTATQDAQTAAFTGIVANPVTGTIGVTQANQTAAFVGFMGDITFWQPNPVVYTRNPVAYVPVGADDDPPW